MTESRHAETQIIPALRQVEVGRAVGDLARDCGRQSGNDLHVEGEVDDMDISDLRMPDAAFSCPTLIVSTIEKRAFGY